MSASGGSEGSAIDVLRARMRRLYENLPEGGSVTLTREALEELLDPSSTEGNGTSRERDMTTDEVADTYGVRAGTVLRWIHSGKLGREGEGWYKLGKRYYVRQIGSEKADTGQRSRRPQSEFRLPRRVPN